MVNGWAKTKISLVILLLVLTLMKRLRFKPTVDTLGIFFFKYSALNIIESILKTFLIIYKNSEKTEKHNLNTTLL